jgi:hypothetical protein
MAAQVVAQTNGIMPGVSVAAGRKGFKAEVDVLRERMRGLGLGHYELAAELGRRYRLRPRESYRLAWGWSLNHAAARFNALSARQGMDPQARAGMTGPHLCEHEHWPDRGRKPSVFTLLMMAQLYETDVLCLLDLADHENLAPQDRLTLGRRPQPQAGRPFTERLVTRMDECTLPPQELARLVLPSPAGPSNIADGAEDTSEHLADPPDRVLDVAAELAVIAETSAPEGKRAAQTSHMRDGADQRSAHARSLSLSLPYVPDRLVIEISDPAAYTRPTVTGQNTPSRLAGNSHSFRIRRVTDGTAADDRH